MNGLEHLRSFFGSGNGNREHHLIIRPDELSKTPGESLALLKANPLNTMYFPKGKLYRNGNKWLVEKRDNYYLVMRPNEWSNTPKEFLALVMGSLSLTLLIGRPF